MIHSQAEEMIAALDRIEGLLIRIANNTARDGSFIIKAPEGVHRGSDEPVVIPQGAEGATWAGPIPAQSTNTP